MNSILFLDFDGVLNSHDYFFDSGKHRRYANEIGQRDPTGEERLLDCFDPDALKRLNRIVDASGCSIVISSSWRLCNSVGAIRRALRTRGFSYPRNVISKTGYRRDGDNTNRRGLEIADWLREHTTGMVRIAILDDSADMGELLPRLVRTTWENGLLEEHIDPTLKLLGATT